MTLPLWASSRSGTPQSVKPTISDIHLLVKWSFVFIHFIDIYLQILPYVFLQEMQAHIDKINEMASVMKKAIEVDEGRLCEDEERIKQLEVNANAHFLLTTLQHIIIFSHISKISMPENCFIFKITRILKSGEMEWYFLPAFGDIIIHKTCIMWCVPFINCEGILSVSITTVLKNSWPNVFGH